MKQDTLLLTIVKFLNCDYFKTLTKAYDADRYSKFMTAQKLLCIEAIVQFAGLTSLRDIENYTEAHAAELKPLGIPRLAHSTVSDALKRMNSKVFEGLYYHLLESLNKRLSKHKRIKNPLAIIDSSTFHVGLNRFPWAHYKKAEGAFKMHLVLNRQDDLSFAHQMVLTDGKESDIRVAENKLSSPPDSIVVCDRGYECKRWFKSLGWTNHRFVCRAKKKTHYYVDKEIPIEDKGKVLSDDEVVLRLSDLRNPRAKRFRRVVLPPFPGHKDPIILITNVFDRTALEIGEIYHTRWEIEKFFKWIKQHLSSTVFLGTSQNAVEIQLWMALIITILVAYLKAITESPATPFTIFRRLKERLFLRITLLEALHIVKRIKILPVSLETYEETFFPAFIT